MAILKITQDVTGQVGIVPQEIYIETNDTLAAVTAVGYLNQARTQGYQFSNRQLAHVYGVDFNNGGPGCLDFQVQTPANPSTGNYSLVNMSSSGEVVLPVSANHLATYVGTTGAIGDDAATAINGGNIQAGLSGTAGHLASFPATAAKGSLRLTGVANTGDTVTTISNAAMGQASVVSIPDPGASTATFLLNTSAGNGLEMSGSNLVVKPDPTGAIIVGPTGVSVSVNNLNGALTISGNSVSVNAGSSLSISGNALNLADNYLKYASGTIPSAQIIDLFNNPILLIPSPGPSKLILLSKFFIWVDFNSTLYTGGSNMILRYAISGLASSDLITSSLLTGAGTSSFISVSQSLTLQFDVQSAANNGLVLDMDAPLTPFANGNSNVRWSLWYSILDVSSV
jgi:hypothetical protein